MTDVPQFEYRVEPLDRTHDRSRFHSGAEELDRYLHQQAGQDAKRRVAATFVLADRSGSILGYHTLSAYGIRLGELPEALARKLPRYPLLSATLLGRLATSKSHRGQRVGRFLLMDALHRSWKNTSEVASVAVVVEALDEDARAFYLRYEFQPLRDHPDKLFIAMATIEKLFRGERTN